MEKTELNLETVTPMFLRGSDNKTPELRPPSFKALFRYWWRTVQDSSWKSLRNKEAELFGSTDGKARFSIRIGEKKDLGDPIKCSPLPHKNGFRLVAYNVDKEFNLWLITKNASDASTYMQIAKLAFLLGGVGNRSRRGFGSIRDTTWDFLDVNMLRNEISNTLNSVAVHFAIDIMNPHYSDYYGDKKPPTDDQRLVPIPFLTVEKTTFRFAFFAQDQTRLNELKDRFQETLDLKGIGAKTSVGYGYFRILE